MVDEVHHTANTPAVVDLMPEGPRSQNCGDDHVEVAAAETEVVVLEAEAPDSHLIACHREDSQSQKTVVGEAGAVQSQTEVLHSH